MKEGANSKTIAMNQQVYKKVGRKYVPIGYSDGWNGFPADGIWVVQTKDGCKSSECMMRVGEIQDLRPTIDILINHRDDIVNYITNNPSEGRSLSDYVTDMLKAITNNA